MVRAIRNSTIAVLLIGSVLGAGITLSAASSRQDGTACSSGPATEPETGSRAEVGDNGPDEFSTSEDAPTAIGLGGADCLNGRSGSDTLLGGDGRDELRGGAGEDYLDGGNGSNRFSGGEGNDIIKSGGTSDRGVTEVIYGGEDGDLIFLSGGSAEVFAGPGDDTIVAANGWPDVIDCGDGNDQVSYEPEDTITDCEDLLPLSSRIRKPGLVVTR